MIKGIGIDIIEIHRIGQAISRNDRFLDRIFTLKEQRLFEEKNYITETIAGHFAAKEATVKALGTGISNIKWTDIEILNDSLGKPYVALYNNAKIIAESMGIHQILISISHNKSNAVAQAIAI